MDCPPIIVKKGGRVVSCTEIGDEKTDVEEVVPGRRMSVPVAYLKKK
jgi:hypothetical protein